MGSFDIFCALCSGSLCHVDIGSKSKRQREVRQRFITEKIRELETLRGEHNNPNVSYESSEEQWEMAKETQEIQSEDEQELESEEEEEEEEEEDEDGGQSYDPDIVNAESTKWLRILHVLGYNPRAAGPSKAYISGEGMYFDYGGVEISLGDDPNSPQVINSVSCYGSRVLTAFPFHWCCFEILTRVLTGSTDIGKVDKDILYNVMLGLSPEYASRLAIYYGEIMGVDQFWESVPGEEYSVTHPTIIPGFEEALRKLISEKTFKVTSTSRLQLASKVKWDPFSKLPYDIIYSVLRFLPGDSTRAFMVASWAVYNATRHPTLWKQLMYWGMPWFWELHKLVDEHSTDLDYKNLYLWLDKATIPVYGMDGPFLGIANRRRIWGACTQLAEIYFSSFHQRDQTSDEDLNSVLQESQIMQLPMVKYPQPTMEVRTISKQWLRTLEEFDSRSAVLETLWTSDEYLMGLSVIFGTSRRVFGRAAATDGVIKRIILIGSDDWITGLVLYMPGMDLLDNHACTAVRGIEIIFKSGKQAMIGDNQGNHRPFIVSKDHYLVGLVGQTGEDEIISRFGILESPITENNEFSVHNVKLVPASERPFSQRLLWSPGVSLLESYTASPYGRRPMPIWNHPNIHVLSSNRTGDMSHGVPGDLVPYQPLIWALRDHEFQKLTQISAYVKTDITSSGPRECVLGLRVAYTRRYWEPKRYVGEFPGQDNEDVVQEAPDGEIRHFEIDGPNSEYVVGVDIAMGDSLKAIKLRTNRGREVCFGDQNQDDWEVSRPAGGDMFTGLAATFRPLAGYSTISKKATRFMMSSVIALTRTIIELK